MTHNSTPPSIQTNPHLTAKLLLLFLTVASVASLALLATATTFVQRSRPSHNLLGPEKHIHLRFYWHDVWSGRNPTAVTIRPPITNTSATGFGTVVMIDGPLTVGPNLTSKLVGRAQGMYAYADEQSIGLTMGMNLVFTEGKFNGSTLAVLGRNSALLKVRELAVVGGTGVFRFARGYRHWRTLWFDPNSGDVTARFDIFVRHY